MKQILLPFITVCLAISIQAQEAQTTPRDDRDTQIGHDNGKKDNTARNSRDKDGQTLTAEDQSNAPEDIRISADLRKVIVGDPKLSITAKNIKIITIGKVVTLRGPVQSEQEKTQIETAAKSVTGLVQLKNELEVKQP